MAKKKKTVFHAGYCPANPVHKGKKWAGPCACTASK